MVAWNRHQRGGVGGNMRMVLLGWGLGGWLSCGWTTSPSPSSERSTAEALPEAAHDCPVEPIVAAVAPDVGPQHRTLDFWLAKVGAAQADAVLVSTEQVSRLNIQSSDVEGAWHNPLDPLSTLTAEAIDRSLNERIDWLGGRVADGRLVEGQPGDWVLAEQIADRAQAVDRLHVVVEETSLWCIALDTGLYRPPLDPAFDRNRCASLHPGEVIRVVRRSPDQRWLYADAGYTTGWLHTPVLTPPLRPEDLRGLFEGSVIRPLADDVRTEGGRRLRLGTVVPVVHPVVPGGAVGTPVLVPTAQGLVEDRIAPSARVTDRPLDLTRRALWSLVLAEQDTPYGWGGTAGHRDCSRLLRDVFATFGIQLGRHSAVQAKLGPHRVDVSAMSEDQKRAALREWSARGALLLYMPGHIMLYLGEDEGRHYAVSAMSEYLKPCPGADDTVVKLGRVAVTTLELGRGTERTAFIERLQTLVVFGPPPPGEPVDG